MGKSDLLKDSMKAELDGLRHPRRNLRKRRKLHQLRQKKSLLYIAILLLTRVFIRV